MQTVMGSTPGGGNPRQLDCWLESDGQVGLWIHSPESDENGWEIHVAPHDLLSALEQLGITASALR